MKIEVGDIFLDNQEEEWNIIYIFQYQNQDYYVAEKKINGGQIRKNFIHIPYSYNLLEVNIFIKEVINKYHVKKYLKKRSDPLDLTIFGVTGALASAACYFLGF